MVEAIILGGVILFIWSRSSSSTAAPVAKLTSSAQGVTAAKSSKPIVSATNKPATPIVHAPLPPVKIFKVAGGGAILQKKTLPAIVRPFWRREIPGRSSFSSRVIAPSFATFFGKGTGHKSTAGEYGGKGSAGGTGSVSGGGGVASAGFMPPIPTAPQRVINSKGGTTAGKGVSKK